MVIKRFENISPVLFDTNCSFKWFNTLSLTKELFIEVSAVHCSHLVIFISVLQGKSCFGTHFKVACLDQTSFGCVCSMKMELLKHVSLVLFDKNQ